MLFEVLLLIDQIQCQIYVVVVEGKTINGCLRLLSMVPTTILWAEHLVPFLLVIIFI
jgi:hypothetical protein